MCSTHCLYTAEIFDPDSDCLASSVSAHTPSQDPSCLKGRAGSKFRARQTLTLRRSSQPLGEAARLLGLEAANSVKSCPSVLEEQCKNPTETLLARQLLL